MLGVVRNNASEHLFAIALDTVPDLKPNQQNRWGYKRSIRSYSPREWLRKDAIY